MKNINRVYCNIIIWSRIPENFVTDYNENKNFQKVANKKTLERFHWKLYNVYIQ